MIAPRAIHPPYTDDPELYLLRLVAGGRELPLLCDMQTIVRAVADAPEPDPDYGFQIRPASDRACEAGRVGPRRRAPPQAVPPRPGPGQAWSIRTPSLEAPGPRRRAPSSLSIRAGPAGAWPSGRARASPGRRSCDVEAGQLGDPVEAVAHRVAVVRRGCRGGGEVAVAEVGREGPDQLGLVLLS